MKTTMSTWTAAGAFALAALFLFQTTLQAAREDCGELPANFPKPAVEAAEDDPNTQNDYSSVVEEDLRPGVVYLALSNGSSPNANDCGLSPSNDQAAWTGWGGPIDLENVTIGEGPNTRNEIVIGGVYYKRGLGAHAVSTLVYDLSGANYVKFEAWVGMSDEKDPGDCGHGGTSDFTFSIDGEEIVKTPTLRGTDGGANVPPFEVTFDIPANASQLTIVMGDGGDGVGCDHSSIGDAKLLTSAALSVDPNGKASALWGTLKSIR